eukprot:3556457-Pyramimonas_sp.AAC.1
MTAVAEDIDMLSKRGGDFSELGRKAVAEWVSVVRGNPKRFRAALRKAKVEKAAKSVQARTRTRQMAEVDAEHKCSS